RRKEQCHREGNLSRRGGEPIATRIAVSEAIITRFFATPFSRLFASPFSTKGSEGWCATAGQSQPTESHCLEAVKHRRRRHFHASDRSELTRRSATGPVNL